MVYSSCSVCLSGFRLVARGFNGAVFRLAAGIQLYSVDWLIPMAVATSATVNSPSSSNACADETHSGGPESVVPNFRRADGNRRYMVETDIPRRFAICEIVSWPSWMSIFTAVSVSSGMSFALKTALLRRCRVSCSICNGSSGTKHSCRLWTLPMETRRCQKHGTALSARA